MKLDMLHRNMSLKEVLNDYKDYPAVSINWVSFGSAGRASRPAEGGVLRWYTHCDPEPKDNLKTIVNSYYLLSLDGHPHNFYYRYASEKERQVATVRDGSSNLMLILPKSDD